MMEKPLDLGYNAASFMWDPRLGARVSGGEGREGGSEGRREREGGEREQEGRLRRLLKLLLFLRLYYASTV